MREFLAKHGKKIADIVRRRKLYQCPGYSHEDLLADVHARFFEKYVRHGVEPNNVVQCVHWFCGESIRDRVDPSGVGLSGYNPSRVTKYARLIASGEAKEGDEAFAYRRMRKASESSLCDVATPSSSPCELAEESQTIETLKRAIERLSEPTRTRVKMFFSGKTFHEIAEAEGIAPHYARHSVSQGLRRIQKSISNVPGVPETIETISVI